MKLLVKGIGQLVTVCEGRRFLAGKDMADITVRSGCLAVAVDLKWLRPWRESRLGVCHCCARCSLLGHCSLLQGTY